jgi:hypothetical protein
MPRVEVYGQPRVDLRPVSGAKLTAVPSPDVFGAGLGDVAERVGEHFYSAIEDEARRRADEVALTDFSRQSDEWEHQHLYDPQTGVTNTVHGKDALGLSADLGDAYDKFSGDLIATLNPRQQLAAQKQAVNKHAQIVRTLDAYGSREMDAYETATTNGAISNSQNLAAANASDPPRVAQEIAKQQSIVEGYAQHAGLSPDARDEMMGKVLTGTHVGVINQLLASDQDTAAQTYFDAAKGQINGEALAGVQKALEAGTLRGQGQRFVDALPPDLSETDALDKVKTITDPKLRDEVQSRVVQEYGLRKQAARDDADKQMTDLANLIDQHPARGVRAIDSATWSGLPISERMTLEMYAKRNQTADGEGKTNMVNYYRLMDQAANDPSGFVKDLTVNNLLRNIGGKTEQKQLIELRDSIIKGQKADAEKTLSGFRTSEQVVSDTLDAAGIKRTGEGADLATIARFRSALDAQVEAFQQLKGKKATSDDVQEMSDQLLSKSVLTPNGWWSQLTGHGPVTAKRLLTITPDDVPSAFRAQAESALRRAGKPVSDDAIVQLYIDSQMRGRQ